ncbi:MAG: contact-dependent growth inhibition system immunity protein [Bacteroidia bacterium]|nr:contact-dependent growth inhibition system immunity protein [Bacteroidia bacterium]MDW8348619.1 contact-dependent growth inhibition system immunity protein [Bacteroidia bacterium]
MKNLSELLGAVYYPELEHAPISMEDKKINRLSIKPLNEFSYEDIRLLVERKLYLECILEMALRILHQDMWVKAKFYEGDLLVAVCELLPQDIPISSQKLWQDWLQALKVFKQSDAYKQIPDNIIQRKITLSLKKHGFM